MKALRATLILLVHPDGPRVLKQNCTARAARGCAADMVILSRTPRRNSKDHLDYLTFVECLSNSVVPILVLKNGFASLFKEEQEIRRSMYKRHLIEKVLPERFWERY